MSLPTPPALAQAPAADAAAAVAQDEPARLEPAEPRGPRLRTRRERAAERYQVTPRQLRRGRILAGTAVGLLYGGL